jgi:hypothetical protein
MDIPTQDELVDQIDEFLLRHDMAETRFGRETVNNPAFLRGLRAGSPPKLDTLIKLQSYMERKDAELRINPPPLELTAPPGDEEDELLPFSTAPVSPTGGCSPICSSTIERATTPLANGSCRCSEADGQAVAPSPSCSADSAAISASALDGED